MTGETDDDGREFHELLCEAGRLMARGFARRRSLVLQLSSKGLRPPAIARELERRARSGGCSEPQIAGLGISVHNVRVILRARHPQQSDPVAD